MSARYKGFTLIELMLAIALLAMTAGIVIPRLNTSALTRTRLDKDTAHLAATARYAHNLAITTGIVHLLYLDTDNNRYWITTQSDPRRKSINLPLGQLSEDIRFVSIQGKNTATYTTSLRFSPQGWADTSVIQLADSENNFRYIFIHPLLGRVDIYDTCPDLVPILAPPLSDRGRMETFSIATESSESENLDRM